MDIENYYKYDDDMNSYNIIFLDFDGVLNNNNWFHRRHKESEGGEYYRDHSESLLPLLDNTWYDLIKSDRHHSIVVKSFYKNINLSNLNILIKTLKKIDNPAIVLSTSWRHGLSLQSWNVLFNKIPGWEYKIIGMTPTHTDTKSKEGYTIMQIAEHSDWSRRKEITTWINYYIHVNKGRLNSIKRYAILDDDDIYCTEPWQKEKLFFRTRRELGLTNKISRKIVKYFNNEEK